MTGVGVLFHPFGDSIVLPEGTDVPAAFGLGKICDYGIADAVVIEINLFAAFQLVPSAWLQRASGLLSTARPSTAPAASS